MEVIDPHIHIESLVERDLEMMALAGVSAVISPVALPDVRENISSEALFAYCERVLNYHSWRIKRFFIDSYLCPGVSMVGVPIDYKKALEILPDYLERDRVVGIGEIGFEPSSPTCPDLTIQEEILKVQLSIARESGKPVVIHTPHTEKPKWVKRYLEIIRGSQLVLDKVVIEHADASVVKMIVEAGCNAGITVQPWRRLTPADAAAIIQQQADLNHILVNSDCNPVLASDPLSVPKTSLEMKKLGMKGGDIKKVLWENPKRIFNLD